MTIKNNTVFAEEGKYLKTKVGIVQSISIGKYIALIDNNIITEFINESEIIEVTPVLVEDEICYITSSNYNDAVSELIRSKYTLDQELALYSNFRLGKDLDEEEQFQKWRSACKRAAKHLFK